MIYPIKDFFIIISNYPSIYCKILSKQFKSNDQDISTQLNTLNDNLDILVKYGLYSDVFNYYSKLLASRLKNT